MYFIGLVTQKDKPTGVTLKAKVVTANKKRSSYKEFKVSVKANGLDDNACCIIDHATAVEKINSSQDMTQVIGDVSLTYNGVNGTTIEYKIIDVNTPDLSSYIGNNGKIIGRPKYGEGDAVGYIEITVSKGEASITSRIQTIVKAITAEEVLNDANFTQAGLWNLIRGNNDTYQQSNEWSGHNNIHSNLNLISSKQIDNISNEAVNITWKVQDNTVSYATGVYTEPRINETTGEVARCSYKDACTLVDAIPNKVATVLTTNNNALQNRVRIGGIVLTATITLNGVSKDIVFNCSTISKYLTNAEISEVVLSNIYLLNENTGTQIFYKETTENAYATILAPADGGTYILRAFGNGGSKEFESTALKLKAGEIIGVTIQNTMLNYNGIGVYANAALLADAFNGGFQPVNEFYSELTIDFNALKDASESDKTFACGVSIAIAGYSSDGISPAGSGYNISRYAQIQINTNAMTEAEETTA